MVVWSLWVGEGGVEGKSLRLSCQRFQGGIIEGHFSAVKW